MVSRSKTNTTAPKEPYNTKMKYPGPEYYTGFGKTCPLSPCMSTFWRSQPIRQGKKILDTEHDTKPEDPEEPEGDND